MPRPDTRVRIAFDLAAGGSGDFFTLDDPTKGVLGGTVYKLAGDILEDVTEDVRSVTVRRGRSRELERFQAGALSVSLNSQDRKYDPSYRVTQSATGGDSTYEIDVSGTTYVVHEFTTVGTATFTATTPLTGVEYLVVAGGGGGGGASTNRAGGGGAGGMLTGSTSVTEGSHSVIIGDGGAGGGPSNRGGNGDNSSALGVTATGGGGGGGGAVGGSERNGSNGGSGGGGSRDNGSGGSGVTGQGNDGGDATATNGAGGGGAGAVGTSAVTGSQGGAGLSSSITGTAVYYAGGGGGGGDTGTTDGGIGGGGRGSDNASLSGDQTAGTNGLGGGGGAARNAGTDSGAAGGSGIVIIRYPKGVVGTPFAASMRPRKAITVTADGEPVFNGVVEDWDIAYSLDGDHVAGVKATDGFVFLANENIDAHTTSAQDTGARIEAILDRSEINWPAGKRNIDTGTEALQADTIEAGQNALEYLKKVDEAEQGALFIAADGRLTFRDKASVQTLANVKFADDGTGIPFTSIDAAYGSEELRNRVTVSRLNGGTATAEDSDSITAYGAIDYEIRDTLLSTDAQAQALADLIVTRYAEPLLRIDSVEVVTNALTAEQTTDALALELGDLVEIVYTPSGIGDPINQFVRIDSIEHTIDAAQHRIKFSFSRGEGVALVLDSATFGILNSNTLGY